jgi:glycerol uptake facilitator protein
VVGLIFAITDEHNQPIQGNVNPFIIGFLIVAIIDSVGLNTRAAINSMRDSGPRLWVAIVSGGASLNSCTWIPIAASLLGDAVRAFIYDFTIAKVLITRPCCIW